MQQEAVDFSPWALLAELDGQAGTVMLHSASNADGIGNSTFVASLPWREIIVHGDEARLVQAGEVLEATTTQPAQAMERWLAAAGIELQGAPAALPWAAGYFGYEFAASLGVGTKLPRPRPSRWPDVWLGIYTAMCRWSSDTQTGVLLTSPAHHTSTHFVQAVRRAAAAPRHASAVATQAPMTSSQSIAALQPRHDDSIYMAAVDEVQRRIAAGDVYQVNIARQLTAAWNNADAHALYRALSQSSPAPFGGVVQLAGGSIITNSPELLLRKHAGEPRLETRPIKGTRRLASRDLQPSPQEEAAVVVDLLASEKDGAEHDMIVDLERNDLGRICEIGSVRVERHGYALTLPHLVHRVSRICGDLRPEVGLAEMLEAVFPGGSITGAPKLAAMQLIAALEPFARGPYCGAIGFLASGEVALSVAIRTALLADGELIVTVGGGIVADSVPAVELEETETKAMGFAAALRAAGAR